MTDLQVPKTSSGWTTVAFGDVVQLSRERSRDPEEDGFERYVGLEHIDPGELRIRRWGDIADGTSFTSVFHPGQVLFGKRRAYQRKVAVAEFSGVCSGDIYVLEPTGEALLPELLPFICQTDAFFEHAVGTSAGSLSPRTNWRSLARFEFALPPIEEQRRMVGALTAAATYQEALLRLEDSSRRAWLSAVQSIENRYSNHSKPLDDLLADIQPGRSLVASDSPPVNGEFGVLKVSAIDPFGFRPQESKALLNQNDFIAQHAVRKGVLLITRANTLELVGETCLVDRDYCNLMLSDKTLRLVPAEGVSTRLVWHLLQSNRVRQQIASVATGTGGAMKNISQPEIRALEIGYPASNVSAVSAEELLDSCFARYRAARSRRARMRAIQSKMLNTIVFGDS